MDKNNSPAILTAFMASKFEEWPGTRVELASAIGVGDGTLGRIKYGNGNQTLETVDRIADYFKLKAWQLLAGEEVSSQPARLDPHIIGESISALRHVAARLGREFDEVTNADDIAAVIELRMALPAHPTQAQVIDFGDRVREILERAERVDGNSGGSGAGASIGGADRIEHVEGGEGKARASRRKR